MIKKISSIGKVCLAATGIFLFQINSEALAKPKNVQASAEIAPQGKKVFIFNPKSLNWAIYSQNGKLIRSGHAVGGQNYCKDIKRGCKTPVGSYQIYTKAGANFKSSKYPLPNGGAPMPYAMFFHGHYAIHGSNYVPQRHASHGCIRVSVADARWMSTALPIGSKVVVKSY